ncbi:hypothetical protein JVU11DRAFT_4073 [Chiua virens]|nr:hypothetical protein JVU11DRAFT_4073 [Chiua virens]
MEAEGAMIGNTPADSVPPDQLITGEAHEQVSASTEVFETKYEETLKTSATQASVFGEVSESQAAGSVFDYNATATETTAAANEQTTYNSWDSWGNESATATATQETTEEAISATASKSAFSFGFSGTGGSTWGMPSAPLSLSNTFGAVGNIGSSLFGDDKTGGIELNGLRGIEGEQADAAGALAGATEGTPAEGAGESEAVTVPPGGVSEVTTGMSMPEPSLAAALEEPVSNTEPSTTEAPTDAQAEEDEGFATKKKTKGGAGGGGKGKKKKK